MPRQAVVLIHGMGEQQPMTLVRRFADAVIPQPPDGRAPYYTRPDRMSGSYELRQLSIPDREGTALPATDLYEFYWAHMMAGNKLTQVWPLLRTLLLRPPWRVSRRLLALYAVMWMLVIVAVGALLFWGADVLRWFDGGPTEVELSSGQAGTALKIAVHLAKIAPFALSLASLWLQRAITGTFVDVARYLYPHPENIEVRQRIRSEAVGLLRSLHARGSYDRIVVVGHSLGSIIGMEAIHHLWAEMNTSGHDYGQLKPKALLDWQERAADLDDAVTGGTHPPRLAWTLARYRRAQQRLWHEQIERGNTWRISDFVTLGSPLAHAALFMADRELPLAARRENRQLPACPPEPELPLHPKERYLASYIERFGEGDDRSRPRRVLHHAAAFGPTRWTNLWYPAALGVFGDLFGGPLAPVFGCGIHDHPIRSGPWWRRVPVYPHTHYFDGFTARPGQSPDASPGTAVGLLRGAVRLNSRRMLDAAHAAAKGRVDLNFATAEELTKLPGVGAKMADRIITYRRAHAPNGFRSVAELHDIRGMQERYVRRILRGRLAVAGHAAPDEVEY